MSSSKLSGRVAIVTAATEGIGLAIARKLAQEGASVVICSRKKENVDAAVRKLKEEGLDVDGIMSDVGKEEDRRNLVEYTVKSKGGIDILVSTAGIATGMKRILECTEQDFDVTFGLNVKSAMLLTQLVVAEMKKRKRGSIVYISSIGAYQPVEVIGLYSVSKTALLSMTKALAKECASYNIRVNCVAPGVINTKFSKPLESSVETTQDVLNKTILGRLGEPEEVAGPVSFLCTDEASYITGETLAVAGGWFSRL